MTESFDWMNKAMAVQNGKMKEGWKGEWTIQLIEQRKRSRN